MQEGGPVEDDMARQWQDYRSGVGAASMMEREAEAADPTLVPAGQNIFGQQTEAMTQSQMSEMLFDMMTGVGGTVKGVGKGAAQLRKLGNPIPKYKRTGERIPDLEYAEYQDYIRNKMSPEEWFDYQGNILRKVQKAYGKKSKYHRKDVGLGKKVSGEIPELKGKHKEEAERLIGEFGPRDMGPTTVGSLSDIGRSGDLPKDLVRKFREGESEYDVLSDVLGYQEGGEVSKTIRGARPVEYNYDDPEMLRGMFSVPASEVGGGEGLRYYSAEKAQGRMPSLDRRVVQARAAQKMAFSPADSIPSAMVEGYFDEPSKASGFLKRLGINKQEGGEVEERKLPGLSGLLGERSSMVDSDEGKKLQMIYSIPAGQVGEGGMSQYDSMEQFLGDKDKRYYLGESPAFKNEEGADKHHFKDYVRMMGERYARQNVRDKMAYSPADSIPAAMVESYFDDPDGYKEGGQVKGDVASGYWGGEQGDYMKALAEQDSTMSEQDSTISEQELKSMALMDHFRKMGTGERVESSDVYNGEPAYKSEEAYRRAFGMQTPLNAKERFTQVRLGLNPEMFTAQRRGLLGKALLQRLGNEVQ